MRRQLAVVLAVLIGISSLLAPKPLLAQNSLCFNVPGITNCISGRIREFWEQNGGLPVFGYPITAAQNEVNADTGQTYLTQWFERTRFEVHPENERPYDVLLGRIGVERLLQQDRDWRLFPKGQQLPGCLWFSETGHSVCDNTQVPNAMTGCPRNICPTGFHNYWRGHGLQDPALNAFAKSLALFGLPLSEPTIETNAAGDTVLMQWFERARFEFHPNNPVGSRVLLGLLGNETRPGIPPKPAEVCDGVDNDQDGDVDEGFPDFDGDEQADCVDTDNDNDGFPDVVEVEAGSDPRDANSTPEVCDGIDNDLNDGVDEGYDLDRDGLGDCVDDDDDNDGWSDDDENRWGSNPRDANSTPEVCGNGIDEDRDGEIDEAHSICID